MGMDVVITSSVYSDDLWAEISYDSYYWAEIRWDAAKGEFLTTIYAPLDGSDRYVFPLLDLQAALERARRRLLELGYGDASQTSLDEVRAKAQHEPKSIREGRNSSLRSE